MISENEAKFMEKTHARDTNFELLRIIAMIMVVALHFNCHGKVMYYVEPFSKKYYYTFFIEYASLIAVNLYVMISGYYMIKSKFKTKKIIKIEMQVIFYSLLIYLLLVILGQVKFSKTELVNSLLPVTTNRYWFITAYIGLYLLIPFINKLANSLSKKEYLTLLVILTICLSVVKTIYPMNDIMNGNGVIWFIYLYLLAGYIRIYFNKKISNFKLLLLYLVTIVVQILVRSIALKTTIPTIKAYVETSYNNSWFYTLIETLAVFLLFKNIKIKNEKINKAITTIASLTLGVYLIHDNKYLRPVLWDKILHPLAYLNSGIAMVIAGIVDVTLIFMVCCVIEKLRQLIFKLFSKTSIIKNIDTKINTFMVKTCNLDNKEI